MTFSSLQEAVDSIQTACGAVSGVKFAPPEPPENVPQYPFVVTYPASFTITQGPQGMLTYLHDIRVELHIARKDLPVDVGAALGYSESIPNAFVGALNDNEAAQGSVVGTFGALGWTGDESTDSIGFSWTITKIKIQVTLT